MRSRILGSLPRLPVRKAAHDYYCVKDKLRERLETLVAPRDPKNLRVLELGCGLNAPMVALFGGAGWNWVGVDVKPVFITDGPRALYLEQKQRWGALRAGKWMAGSYPSLLMHHRLLGALSGTKVWPDKRRLTSYDGRGLPFADDSFDIVVSNAVLEHVVDLPGVATEVARVLAPGGAVDMLWHNFYCPSGSHLPKWVALESPWGHVTGEVEAPGLNRATPEDVRQAFASSLEVTRVVGADRNHNLEGDALYEREGMDALDSAWQARLGDYPQDLLTTRSFLIQCRKA